MIITEELEADADYPIAYAISPQDTALIIHEKELPIRQQTDYASKVWDYNYRLIPFFESKKMFMDSTMFWMNYLADKKGTDIELRGVMKDAEELGFDLMQKDYQYNFQDIDLYFKKIRLRLTVEGKLTVRRKLSTVLKEYGYKRRSKKLISYISSCLNCYEIDTYLAGNEECNIADVSVDDTIIFKLRHPAENKQTVKQQIFTDEILPKRDVIITQFGAPKDLDSLKYYYASKKKQTNLDLLLKNNREVIWSVDRKTKKGDIVLFLCSSGSAETMDQIIKGKIYNNYSLKQYALKEKELHERYAGKIFAVGIAAQEPEEEEQYMGLITDFTLLENPISEEEYSSFIFVNQFGGITRVSESKWNRLKKLIIMKNPLIRL